MLTDVDPALQVSQEDIDTDETGQLVEEQAAESVVTEGEPGTDVEADAADDADDAGEIVVSIGDEQHNDQEEDDHKRAPEWVRELRKTSREKDRRIRELEHQVAKSAAPAQATIVGEKPTLIEFASSDEIAEYETKLEAWHDRKRQADEQQRQRVQAEEQERATWQARLDAVSKASRALKVADMEDAELAFDEAFSVIQQGIVLSGPDDPQKAALLRYALGANPKKAKELATITNPVQFAFAVATLGATMKVTQRKAAVAPERRLSAGGSAAAHVAADSNIAKLEAEARRTGDFTRVFEAKRKQRDRNK